MLPQAKSCLLEKSTVQCRPTLLHNSGRPYFWHRILECRFLKVLPFFYLYLNLSRMDYLFTDYKWTCRKTTKDLFMVMGSLYSACIFLGVSNSSSVQPVVSVERTVYYRERAAKMYSSLPYAVAQVLSSFMALYDFEITVFALSNCLLLPFCLTCAGTGRDSLHFGTNLYIWHNYILHDQLRKIHRLDPLCLYIKYLSYFLYKYVFLFSL